MDGRKKKDNTGMVGCTKCLHNLRKPAESVDGIEGLVSYQLSGIRNQGWNMLKIIIMAILLFFLVFIPSITLVIEEDPLKDMDLDFLAEETSVEDTTQFFSIFRFRQRTASYPLVPDLAWFPCSSGNPYGMHSHAGAWKRESEKR